MSINSIQQELDLLFETVAAFRLGIEGMAGDRLAQFTEHLELLLVTVPPARLPQIGQVLNDTLLAQQRHDYVEVADRLQYELAPLLTRATVTTAET